MGRVEQVGFFARSSRARALPGLCAALALEGLIPACAAVPAALQVHAASAALERAAAQAVASPASRARAERPADRAYRLALAAALLEKALEDAAGGRFESARSLAREAERLASGVSLGGGA